MWRDVPKKTVMHHVKWNEMSKHLDISNKHINENLMRTKSLEVFVFVNPEGGAFKNYGRTPGVLRMVL